MSNEKIFKEIDQLKMTLEQMGSDMKVIMEKISKLEDEQEKNHKKSLLGQLAFDRTFNFRAYLWSSSCQRKEKIQIQRH
jgi:GTP-binding protein EngB required for normal cell division